MIYGLYMLKFPATEIFKATTAGKKFGHRPPVVALKEFLSFYTQLMEALVRSLGINLGQWHLISVSNSPVFGPVPNFVNF